MIFSLLIFFKGYLIIEAEGIFLERFINLAIRNNIFLWDIKKTAKNAMMFKVSIAGFKKIKNAVRKTKTRLRIKEKKGLPFIFHAHKKRKAFLAGTLLFAGIIVFMSSFIWSVEITGNETIDENRIREDLKSCGIGTGVIKYGHNVQDIKRRMLLKNSDIAWIWVYINGTKAVVEIKERTEKPDIVPQNEPCNIKAATDGVIKDMTVLGGKPVVSAGDVVKKGDLLVSGVDDTAAGPVTYHSEGKIYAVTWHEDSGVFPLSRTITKKTGNSQSRFYLKAAGFEISVYPLSKIKFEKFVSSDTEKNLKLWGDLYLPVVWKASYIEEISEENKKMTEREAAEYYGGELLKKIKSAFSAGVTVEDKQITSEMRPDGIFVKCSVRCTEDIGRQVPLYSDENG